MTRQTKRSILGILLTLAMVFTSTTSVTLAETVSVEETEAMVQENVSDTEAVPGETETPEYWAATDRDTLQEEAGTETDPKDAAEETEATGIVTGEAKEVSNSAVGASTAKSITIESMDTLYDYGDGYAFGIGFDTGISLPSDSEEKWNAQNEEYSRWSKSVTVQIDEGEPQSFTAKNDDTYGIYEHSYDNWIFMEIGFLSSSIDEGVHTITITLSRTDGSGRTETYQGAVSPQFVKEDVTNLVYGDSNRTDVGDDYFSAEKGGIIFAAYGYAHAKKGDSVEKVELVNHDSGNSVYQVLIADEHGDVFLSPDSHYDGSYDYYSKNPEDQIKRRLIGHTETYHMSFCVGVTLSAEIPEGWYDLVSTSKKGIKTVFQKQYYATKKPVIYAIYGDDEYDRYINGPWFDNRKVEFVNAIVYGINIDEKHGYPVYWDGSAQITEYTAGNTEEIRPFVKRYVLSKKDATIWSGRNGDVTVASTFSAEDTIDARDKVTPHRYAKDKPDQKTTLIPMKDTYIETYGYGEYTYTNIHSALDEPDYWWVNMQWKIKDLSSVETIIEGNGLHRGESILSQIPASDLKKLKAGRTYRIAFFDKEEDELWEFYYINGFEGGDASVTSVSLSAKSLTMEAGDAVGLKAICYPSGAAPEKITWKSSDETVVTVEPKNDNAREAVIRAVKSGSSTVTVTVDDTYTATCLITVGKDDAADYGDIKDPDEESDIWVASVADQTYTGAKLTPTVRVYDGKKLLTANKDYSLTWANNVKAAKKTDKNAPMVTVNLKGNYSGKKEAYFTINPRNLSAVHVYINSGKTLKPVLTWNGMTLKEKTDYTKEISGDTITFTGTGNYEGTYSTAYLASEKAQTPINKVSVVSKLKLDSMTYTGSPLQPEIKLDGLTRYTDYELSYSNNIHSGTATVWIKGIGTYTGSAKKTFTIQKANVSAFEVSNYLGEVPYLSGGAKPEPVIYYRGNLLTKDKDYTLKYSGNTKAGEKGSLVVSGKGDFTGKRDGITFTVVKQDIANLEVVIDDKVEGKSKTAWISKPVIYDMNGKKLVAGKDYRKPEAKDYHYSGSAPTAGQVVTLNLEGINNYKGTKQVSYRILKSGTDISKGTFVVRDRVYTGSEIILDSGSFLDSKLGKTGLTLDEDFEVESYTANKNNGTATAVLRGIGAYGGRKTVKFKIVAKTP